MGKSPNEDPNLGIKSAGTPTSGGNSNRVTMAIPAWKRMDKLGSSSATTKVISSPKEQIEVQLNKVMVQTYVTPTSTVGATSTPGTHNNSTLNGIRGIDDEAGK